MKISIEDVDDSVLLLSRAQVCRALGVSDWTLDDLHRHGSGPPRLRVSPRRWGYPVRQFREWQQQRLAAENGNRKSKQSA